MEVDEPQSSSLGTNATASVTVNGSLNSASTGDAARSGSPLTSYVNSSNQIHVDYLDGNSHVIEVTPNSNGVTQSWDLTSLTSSQLAGSSSQLTSWWQQSDGPHVLYVNNSGHLQQILNTTGTQDMTVMLGLPAAASGTALTNWVIPDGPFIVYLTTSQHLELVWWSTSRVGMAHAGLKYLVRRAHGGQRQCAHELAAVGWLVPYRLSQLQRPFTADH